MLARFAPLCRAQTNGDSQCERRGGHHREFQHLSYAVYSGFTRKRRCCPQQPGMRRCINTWQPFPSLFLPESIRASKFSTPRERLFFPFAAGTIANRIARGNRVRSFFPTQFNFWQSNFRFIANVLVCSLYCNIVYWYWILLLEVRII